MSKVSCGLRLTFGFVSLLIWVGIFLTGFDKASWVLYLPAIGMLGAAISGICVGGMIFGKLCKN